MAKPSTLGSQENASVVRSSSGTSRTSRSAQLLSSASVWALSRLIIGISCRTSAKSPVAGCSADHQGRRVRRGQLGMGRLDRLELFGRASRTRRRGSPGCRARCSARCGTAAGHAARPPSRPAAVSGISVRCRRRRTFSGSAVRRRGRRSGPARPDGSCRRRRHPGPVSSTHEGAHCRSTVRADLGDGARTAPERPVHPGQRARHQCQRRCRRHVLGPPDEDGGRRRVDGGDVAPRSGRDRRGRTPRRWSDRDHLQGLDTVTELVFRSRCRSPRPGATPAARRGTAGASTSLRMKQDVLAVRAWPRCEGRAQRRASEPRPWSDRRS